MDEEERKFELGKYPRTDETREKNRMAMRKFWRKVKESLEKAEMEIDGGEEL